METTTAATVFLILIGVLSSSSKLLGELPGLLLLRCRTLQENRELIAAQADVVCSNRASPLQAFGRHDQQAIARGPCTGRKPDRSSRHRQRCRTSFLASDRTRRAPRLANDIRFVGCLGGRPAYRAHE